MHLTCTCISVCLWYIVDSVYPNEASPYVLLWWYMYMYMYVLIVALPVGLLVGMCIVLSQRAKVATTISSGLETTGTLL